VLELEELLAVELSRDSGFLLPTSFWSFLPFPLTFFAKLIGFVISLSFVCETLSEEDMTLRLTYACWERTRWNRALRNGGGSNEDNDALGMETTWRDKGHMRPNGTPHKFD
jgi:hypothetical protein